MHRNQSINQSKINEWMNKSINQTINQPIQSPLIQSINRTINHYIYYSLNKGVALTDEQYTNNVPPWDFAQCSPDICAFPFREPISEPWRSGHSPGPKSSFPCPPWSPVKKNNMPIVHFATSQRSQNAKLLSLLIIWKKLPYVPRLRPFAENQNGPAFRSERARRTGSGTSRSVTSALSAWTALRLPSRKKWIRQRARILPKKRSECVIGLTWWKESSPTTNSTMEFRTGSILFSMAPETMTSSRPTYKKYEKKNHAEFTELEKEEKILKHDEKGRLQLLSNRSKLPPSSSDHDGSVR